MDEQRKPHFILAGIAAAQPEEGVSEFLGTVASHKDTVSFELKAKRAGVEALRRDTV